MLMLIEIVGGIAGCGRHGDPWHGWSALSRLLLVLGVAGSVRERKREVGSGVGQQEPPDVERCGEMILRKVKL